MYSEMAENQKCNEWKEQFILLEILSLHMFCIVAEEFVRVYGTENSIHAGYKWRSRREVVDWLTSMLSKQHIQGDLSLFSIIESPKHGLSHATKSLECPSSCLKNLSGHSSDICVVSQFMTCEKQFKHYPAFCRNGTKIMIQSFVFVMAKGENHYVAFLEDMYEYKRGQKKSKVRWFHHNREVKSVVHLRNSHPNEVFITPYSQVISAECVDGPATVLTPEHYDECLAALPDALSAKLHLCSRQFGSNKMKPVHVSKLRGYVDQPILCCFVFRTRYWRHETFLTERIGGRMMPNGPSFRNLKYGLPDKRFLPLKHVKPQKQCYKSFKIYENIEELCQDSGIRGCWFRYMVLQVYKKHIKVLYDDLQNEDESNNVEEWIPIVKLAAPDKLGMRCLGCPTRQPAPPLNEESNLSIEIRSAEGIFIGVGNSSNDILQIYSPEKDLRISRDWVGGHWIDIQAKHDIDYDTSIIDLLPKDKLDPVEEFKTDLAPLISSDCPVDEMNAGFIPCAVGVGLSLYECTTIQEFGIR
ncbi:hypothetical protein K2173_011612 [Erythroxylum novogranatense]|uniref:BAH domain-containing protein n=1 Tax=Erythroxylum novogranatense TaxID=1862640 RepID=A0AAV8U951_9ROSI|nr:hypothetical protein K2173_011612 [Erythroxylum novogranatense]